MNRNIGRNRKACWEDYAHKSVRRDCSPVTYYYSWRLSGCNYCFGCFVEVMLYQLGIVATEATRIFRIKSHRHIVFVSKVHWRLLNEFVWTVFQKMKYLRQKIRGIKLCKVFASIQLLISFRSKILLKVNDLIHPWLVNTTRKHDAGKIPNVYYVRLDGSILQVE